MSSNVDSPSATSKRDKKWNSKFAELKKYIEDHGDCNVKAKNGPLGAWVHEQRKLAKKKTGKGALQADRRKRLEDIGFIFCPWEAQWDDRFKELVKYKEKHGHCKVPAQNSELGNWVWRQRKASYLSEERIDRLTTIGFMWKVKRGRVAAISDEEGGGVAAQTLVARKRDSCCGRKDDSNGRKKRNTRLLPATIYDAPTDDEGKFAAVEPSQTTRGSNAHVSVKGPPTNSQNSRAKRVKDREESKQMRELEESHKENLRLKEEMARKQSEIQRLKSELTNADGEISDLRETHNEEVREMRLTDARKHGHLIANIKNAYENIVEEWKKWVGDLLGERRVLQKELRSKSEEVKSAQKMHRRTRSTLNKRRTSCLGELEAPKQFSPLHVMNSGGNRGKRS
eukprot:CAMPEP_0181083980 /NCGR_PEP_ID=MMETSP1071-20121207/4453_1 /TAXON_ID=35127 /ORGANISM="Thalassiosira sp., Strain NH16" /LENGTH=396 /DNA_ID=CAMNT_0023165687 /DNA_START=255 /DNA_END=1445 /DNA_ORIENTATION=+